MEFNGIECSGMEWDARQPNAMQCNVCAYVRMRYVDHIHAYAGLYTYIYIYMYM